MRNFHSHEAVGRASETQLEEGTCAAELFVSIFHHLKKKYEKYYYL